MKTLIACFSVSGETAKPARTLAGIVNGDLFEIKPETPYTAAGLNWRDKSSRSFVEMRGPSCRKPGKRLKTNAMAHALAKWSESEGRLP